jgi:peptidyl-prolyl cis-trans isomerase SurA
MIKKICYFVLFFLLMNSNLFSKSNVFIQTKVNGEIITNYDIEKEEAYLEILNPQLLKLDKEKKFQISKNSLINELIKINELKKIFNLEKELPLVNEVFKDFYKRLSFNSEKEFKEHLSKNINYNISEIKKKLQVEILWNRLIFTKYKNQIKINKDDLLKKIKNDKNQIKSEFLLSEIFFNKNKNKDLKKQIKQIKESIKEVGFNNTANIFSASESANFGGRIGWVEQDNLSKKIFNELDKIKKGEYTNVMKIGNNFLILKIEDKKTKKMNINIDVKLKQMIEFERNKQLTQFSNIHFNKIKINYSIDEK